MNSKDGGERMVEEKSWKHFSAKEVGLQQAQARQQSHNT